MIYYAFLLFFFLDYVRPGSYVPGLDALHLNSLVPLTVILGTVAARTKFSNQEFFAETNAKLILGFFALICVSVVTATVTMFAYNVWTAVLGYVLITWIIARQVYSIDRIKGVFRTMVLVHLVVAGLNPIMFTDPNNRHYVASGAFLGDGNDFALSVNLVIPFCLFLLFESRKWWQKAISGSALLLLVLSVIATKSRGGTLALGVVGLYYWLKSDRKVLTASLAAAAVVIVLVSAPPAYFERMNQIANTEEGSAQGRILAWTAGVQMALKNPLLGAGAGHFPITYGQFYRTRTDIPWQTAHSIYFLTLGELGVPGITLLLTFIIWNLVANRRLLKEIGSSTSPELVTDRRLLAAVSASLLAYATGGTFLSATYYPHMYVLAGLLIVSRRVVREHLLAPDRQEAGAPTPAAPHAVRPGTISGDWKPRRELEPHRVRRDLPAAR